MKPHWSSFGSLCSHATKETLIHVSRHCTSDGTHSVYLVESLGRCCPSTRGATLFARQFCRLCPCSLGVPSRHLNSVTDCSFGPSTSSRLFMCSIFLLLHRANYLNSYFELWVSLEFQFSNFQRFVNLLEANCNFRVCAETFSLLAELLIRELFNLDFSFGWGYRFPSST